MTQTIEHEDVATEDAPAHRGYRGSGEQGSDEKQQGQAREVAHSGAPARDANRIEPSRREAKYLDKVMSADSGGPYIDPEVTATRERLESERKRIINVRKLNAAILWSIAAAIMVYGMVNVTPFIIMNHVPVFIAPLLSLVIDAALCLSLWSDRNLKLYALKDSWMVLLRWGTGLATLLLNILPSLAVFDEHGNARFAPNWIAVCVHALGPIFLILVSESASSCSRKLHFIVQKLDETGRDMEIQAEEERTELQQLREGNRERDAELEQQRMRATSLDEQLSATIEDRESQASQVQRLMAFNQGTYLQQFGAEVGASVLSNLESAETMAPLLRDGMDAGTDKANLFGHRLLVHSMSRDAIAVVDSEMPSVRKVLDDDPGAHPPASSMISIRALDIGRELISLKDETQDRNEASYLISVLATGSAEGMGEEYAARMVIRSALNTNRLRSEYPTQTKRSGRGARPR